ncbi:MAG: hypothetical protein GF417_10070, partial [Candidatus Latescibacteria bacterium]|nr:hypothetical protein [bacterium]MBD3424772.1 hypothetical protein [Candidatus Latescibacterota bacterium]
MSALFFLAVTIMPVRAAAGIHNVRSESGTVTFEIVVGEFELKETPDGATRIIINGYGTFSPPGAPELPGRIFNVAVPHGGVPIVRAVVLSREQLGDIRLARKKGSRLRKVDDGEPVTETYLPDVDPWEGKGLPPVVSAGRKSMMGRLPVLPVRINPVGKDRNSYWIARKIRVTVEYPEPAGSSTGSIPRGWKRIYERTLVNPRDARGYIKEIDAPGIRMTGQSNGGRSLRIRIPETGFYLLEADSLNSVMGGGPLATGQFAIKRYYYDESEPDLYRERDLPMTVIKGENSSAGYFEEDDLLYFFAEGIRDDAAAGDTIAAFTGEHVVWLRENQFGEMMNPGSGMEPAGEPGDSTFISRERVRKDTFYKKKIRYGARDYYFVALPEQSSVSSDFFCRDLYPEGEFSVTVSLRGYYETDNKNLRFEIENSNGTNQIGTGTLMGEEVRFFYFSSLPSEWLSEGENTLVISSQSAPYPVLINHFTVEYDRMMNIR